MPTIVKLEASKHIRGRILVFFQDAELVKLTEEEILLHRLYAGKTLTAAEYDDLTEAAKLSSAKAAAARICSARMLSRGELLQKLKEKGESVIYAEMAADWLEELGILNDSRYAGAVVRHYVARGCGRKKLEQELFRRRIPREYWSDALQEADIPEDTLDRLIEKRLRGKTPDAKDLSRLQGFLLRRGFGWDEVQDALERYQPDWE